MKAMPGGRGVVPRGRQAGDHGSSPSTSLSFSFHRVAAGLGPSSDQLAACRACGRMMAAGGAQEGRLLIALVENEVGG